jgi:hypothetical protein
MSIQFRRITRGGEEEGKREGKNRGRGRGRERKRNVREEERIFDEEERERIVCKLMTIKKMYFKFQRFFFFFFFCQ